MVAASQALERKESPIPKVDAPHMTPVPKDDQQVLAKGMRMGRTQDKFMPNKSDLCSVEPDNNQEGKSHIQSSVSSYKLIIQSQCKKLNIDPEKVELIANLNAIHTLPDLARQLKQGSQWSSSVE
jgi:hypothetical protein